MQSHQLPKLTARRSRRVGRGGKRGSYSGKGMKGQRSRAGRRIRPQVRDVIKKIHKRRGYAFKSIQKKPHVVNIGDIARSFQPGEKVTVERLEELGLIRIKQSEKPIVKILGSGKLDKKLSFDKDFLFSKTAKSQIEL